MSQAVKCLILLAVVALLFVTELIPLAITATAGVCRYVHRWRSNVLYRFGPKNR